ncbi:unnamed protein product [Brassica oleracea]
MTISTLVSIPPFTLPSSSTKPHLLTPTPTRAYSSSISPRVLNQNRTRSCSLFHPLRRNFTRCCSSSSSSLRWKTNEGPKETQASSSFHLSASTQLNSRYALSSGPLSLCFGSLGPAMPKPPLIPSNHPALGSESPPLSAALAGRTKLWCSL